VSDPRIHHYIGGEWIKSDRPAAAEQVDHAIEAARAAQESWQSTSMEQRAETLNRYALELKRSQGELAQVISEETGKPIWESLAEVDAMIKKVAISIEAQEKLRKEDVRAIGDARGITRFKAHGVAAVLGPFNMPGHLPNGHIVPALLAGNTVVIKPSEYTPLIAQEMGICLEVAELPKGVFNIVQGARETGTALVTHRGIDAIYFTGSVAAGVAINKANAHRPGVILALEMGGNNPLVVWDVADLKAAALMVIQSAFITSGQRCSCARRLFVAYGADAFLSELVEMAKKIRVGPYTNRPEPFMGRVISDAAAEKLLQAQQMLIDRGGKVLLEMKSTEAGKAFLTPGIIDVSYARSLPDAEFFGPLLQVLRMNLFDMAIFEANCTKYGLCAGLLSDDRSLWEKFYARVKAGVIHWNRPTTGASSALPFGGIGDSGNHRPAGYFSAEYCSYPVAVLESDKLSMPGTIPPGIAL
jgi:succinylglutamic semialdehyde dehydrogenase